MKRLICCAIVLMLAGCIPIGFKSSNLFEARPAEVAFD